MLTVARLVLSSQLLQLVTLMVTTRVALLDPPRLRLVQQHLQELPVQVDPSRIAPTPSPYPLLAVWELQTAVPLDRSPQPGQLQKVQLLYRNRAWYLSSLRQ